MILWKRLYVAGFVAMKKYFVFLCPLLFLACSDEVPQGATWKQLKDVAFEGRVFGLSFSLLGKGYLVSGPRPSNSDLTDVWSYDPKADSWTRLNDYPFSFVLEFAATTNDRAYIIDYTGRLYEYNPTTDSWKFLSEFPTGYRAGLTGFGLGGDVYFGTGHGVTAGSGYLKDFWKYDVSENEWTRIDDFPGTARSTAVSFVIGDNAYVGLGSSAGAPPIHTDFYRYNANTGKWFQIANLPTADYLVGLSFSNDSKGYIGLAEKDYAKMYEYDPNSNSWKQTTTFQSEFCILTNSFTVNSRMFVFGGMSVTYGRHVWEFLP